MEIRNPTAGQAKTLALEFKRTGRVDSQKYGDDRNLLARVVPAKATAADHF